MIFGDWRESLSAEEDLPQGHGEHRERHANKAHKPLPEGLDSAEVCDFLVQVGESRFERLAMIGVGGGGEVVGNSRAR